MRGVYLRGGPDLLSLKEYNERRHQPNFAKTVHSVFDGLINIGFAQQICVYVASEDKPCGETWVEGIRNRQERQVKSVRKPEKSKHPITEHCRSSCLCL